MPDQQIQNKTPDDLDEVLVKEPDGTFRVMKITPAQAPAVPVQTPPSSVLPRVVQPAPVMRSLADDEEKEVAGLAERAKILGAVRADDTDARVRQAIAASGVTLADQALGSRLATVLVAYCKEVRNELETRALLMKPKEAGGLALTANEATRLLSSISTGVKLITSVPAPASVIPQLPAIQKSSMSQQVVVQQPVAPSVPVSITSKPSPQPLPVKPIMPAPQKPVALRPVNAPLQEKRLSTEAKPIVQDVTFTPTLVGPVDELRMSLLAWRRMAPTIKDRATKIEEKLRLLEEESYPERLKGIAAWYGSEVVRQYEDVGRASLMTGKSVADILTERQAAGTSALSLEEFQSIAELHEKLRF